MGNQAARGREADREQHSRQEGVGQGSGDPSDGGRQRAPDCRQNHQQPAGREGPDGSRPASMHRAGGHEQCRARRGPRDGDRHSQTPRQRDSRQAHGERQREQAGGRLVGAGANRAQPGEHDGERARETHDGRDDAGEYGLEDVTPRTREQFGHLTSVPAGPRPAGSPMAAPIHRSRPRGPAVAAARWSTPALHAHHRLARLSPSQICAIVPDPSP